MDNRRNTKPWTFIEEAALKQLYGTMPSDELAAHFDRSEQSVTNKASELGIATGERLKPRKVRYWKSDEEQLLRRMYQMGMQPATIAEIVDRTEDSIKAKASELGISKNR